MKELPIQFVSWRDPMAKDLEPRSGNEFVTSFRDENGEHLGHARVMGDDEGIWLIATYPRVALNDDEVLYGRWESNSWGMHLVAVYVQTIKPESST